MKFFPNNYFPDESLRIYRNKKISKYLQIGEVGNVCYTNKTSKNTKKQENKENLGPHIKISR